MGTHLDCGTGPFSGIARVLGHGSTGEQIIKLAASIHSRLLQTCTIETSSSAIAAGLAKQAVGNQTSLHACSHSAYMNHDSSVPVSLSQNPRCNVYILHHRFSSPNLQYCSVLHRVELMLIPFVISCFSFSNPIATSQTSSTIHDSVFQNLL